MIERRDMEVTSSEGGTYKFACYRHPYSSLFGLKKNTQGASNAIE